ncbi:Ig-like domain-containing protein [Niabella sp.]|uniref:Ig-like domain-containing protein n=1 Tax=Niabella sp. TaxID=1962976 RepID=UPI00261B2040|nr:Ig-like domain-containing protein [Niabella sp.]
MRKTRTIALVTIALLSCGKKDSAPQLSLSATKVDIKYDETTQVNASIGVNSDYSWKSSDEFVGKVDASGKFTAGHIGKTTVTAEKSGVSKAIEITVSPIETFFSEPVLEFGQSMDYVKSKEKRMLFFENSDGFVYKTETPLISQILYLFSSNKLNSALVDFIDTESTMKRALAFYNERYYYAGYSDGTAVFVSKDKSAFVGLEVSNYSWGFGAMYLKNTTGAIALSNNTLSLFNREYLKVTKNLKVF